MQSDSISFRLFMIFTVWLVSILELVSASAPFIYEECIYASPKKYIGYFYYYTGQADPLPFYSAKESSRDSCNKRCMANEECLATSIDQSKICSFYNTSDFIVKGDKKIDYSLWKPCKLDGDQPEDGRCKGLWVTFLQQLVTVDSYGILDQMAIKTGSSRSQCRNKCLENKFCGFIQLRYSQCLLVPKWPSENIVYNTTEEEGVKVDRWTCASHFIETFNFSKPETDRKPIDDKCMGHWVLASRDSRLSCPDVIGILFHTQVYRECLAECELHPSCLRVYYNFTYSVCVLDCVETSDHALHPPNMTFMEFKWVCARNDSRRPAMNADERRLAGLGMKCSKITDNTDMFIALDRCAACPPRTAFSKCDEVFDRSSRWRIKDSCRLNQSYWAFPSETRHLNISGYGTMIVTRVFTGLELYWLAYLDGDDLIGVDHLECRVFNASRPAEKLNPQEIVSKKAWHHQHARRKLIRFPRLPIKVVISASQEPLHSCRTTAAGKDLMRWIQVLCFRGGGNTKTFSDVPFNFYVDENGNIYEGRGWSLQSAAVGAFNAETIAIGFIGWFKFELPSERFVNSVKKLIEFGVEHRHIDSGYTLYIKQDISVIPIGRNLVVVVRNWYRYKGFVPKICSQMPILTIFSNLLAAAVCVGLFGIVYQLCFFSGSCKNCRFLSTDRLVFEKIFPSDTSSMDMDDMLSTPDRTKLVHVILERRPEASEKPKYSRLVTTIKTWFYNMFLSSSSSQCAGNSLESNLRHLPAGSTDCEIYEAELVSRFSTDSSAEKVIACVSSTGSGVFLRNLITSRSCICTYFRIATIDQQRINQDMRACVNLRASSEEYSHDQTGLIGPTSPYTRL